MRRLAFFPVLLLCAPALASPGHDHATPPEPAPAAIDGQAVFRQRCQSCHAVEPGQYSPIGPNLAGVVGRAAGATEFRYSAALKNSGITWTREKLDKYVAAPTTAVPGTRMAIGLADPAQRAAVIGFLASAGK